MTLEQTSKSENARGKQIIMAHPGVALDVQALKTAVLEEISKGEKHPLQVVESLTNKGFPMDEVRTALMNLLSSGELLLTNRRLLQPSL